MKKATVRITQGSGNVFLDLGFPPHEAAVMLLRCELAEALRKWMSREKLTQASRCGATTHFQDHLQQGGQAFARLSGGHLRQDRSVGYSQIGSVMGEPAIPPSYSRLVFHTS